MAKVYQGVSPCRNCKERLVGCHAECEKYLGWKAAGVEIVNDPPRNDWQNNPLWWLLRRRRR